jgi:CBS-domain-containing membrane protein
MEASSTNATAESVMTRNPVTCYAEGTLLVAAKRMWEHDVGALPVTDAADRVVGMITDRDVAMAAYTRGKGLEEITVESVMSTGVWCVMPQAPLTEVEALMQQHKVRRIPVVDQGRHPIGMITIDDLARHVGPLRYAPITPEELAQTLRAVCEPRALPA